MGVFLRQREIDQEICGGEMSDWAKGRKSDNSLLEMGLGEQERGLRRKDILQAVPLVCVMVPKG